MKWDRVIYSLSICSALVCPTIPSPPAPPTYTANRPLIFFLFSFTFGKVLRLLCAQCLTNNGFKPKMLEFYSREILQVRVFVVFQPVKHPSFSSGNPVSVNCLSAWFSWAVLLSVTVYVDLTKFELFRSSSSWLVSFKESDTLRLLLRVIADGDTVPCLYSAQLKKKHLHA